MTASPATSRQAIDLLPESARAFGVVLERLDDGAWGRPTPCAEWSVREVVNHVVAEHLWVPHLLRGESLEEVGQRYEGNVLGASPAEARRAWQMAMLGSLQAWAQVEDPEQPVAFSGGEHTAGEYAHQMLVDLVVHAWDVAQGGGVSVPVITDAVGVAFGYEKPRVAEGRAAGLFGPPTRPRSDHPMDQLVALLGR